MNAVIYKLSTGQILRCVVCPNDMIGLQFDPQSESFIEGGPLDDTTMYVQNGEFTPRPVFAETINGTEISGLPIPTQIRINGATYEVTDGSAELSFDYPGVYQVQLTGFPYVDKTVEVTQL